MEINFNPTPQQHKFFLAFENPQYREILYGGAAGGAKSYALWSLMIIKCIQYPGIVIGIGRDSITDIKKYTMQTFFEICRHWNIPNNYYYYNSHDGKITFQNGSVIMFFALAYMPSDPDYAKLGGSYLTFACIEEGGSVDERGKNALKSRIGRYRNEEFGIKPKLLITCNPSMNWLYNDFYKPWRQNELPQHRLYIPAKLSDNPYLGQDYRQILEDLDPISKSRLLYGEWDFDGDKTRLIKYDKVLNLYNVNNIINQNNDLYLSADIAMTSDKCIFILWQGFNVIKIFNYKGDTPAEELIKIRDQYKVDPRNVVFDSDGIGQLLKGQLRMAYPFNNGSKALYGENYDNLKTQCYFKLAELINKDQIKILDDTLRETLIQEVYSIRSKPLETMNGKIKMVSKAEMIKEIGHSPDISDALMVRMVFEIKPKATTPSAKFL